MKLKKRKKLVFLLLGIPVLAGIYGTNPAGGGYQGISGMSPKGHFDVQSANELIDAARQYKEKPPGSVDIHYHTTGFFRYAYEKETGGNRRL